jgi:hypothetical protein
MRRWRRKRRSLYRRRCNSRIYRTQCRINLSAKVDRRLHDSGRRIASASSRHVTLGDIRVTLRLRRHVWFMLDLLLLWLLLMWWRRRKDARSRLDGLRRGLSLENGIIAQTLTLALLTVATSWMTLITLDSTFPACQTASFCATLDLLLMPCSWELVCVELRGCLVAHMRGVSVGLHAGPRLLHACL